MDKGADADFFIGPAQIEAFDGDFRTGADQIYGNVDVPALTGEDDVLQLQFLPRPDTICPMA